MLPIDILDLNSVSQRKNCFRSIIWWHQLYSWYCLGSCPLTVHSLSVTPVTCQGVEVSKSDIRWRSMTKHANVSRFTFIWYSGLFINCLFTDIFIILYVRTFAIFWRIYLFLFWTCSLSRYVLYMHIRLNNHATSYRISHPTSHMTFTQPLTKPFTEPQPFTYNLTLTIIQSVINPVIQPFIQYLTQADWWTQSLGGMHC